MQKQSSIVIGLVLILAGVLFLLLQAFPEVAARFDLADQWPLIIIGIGALILTIIAGLQANQGNHYEYPINWRLVK